MRMESEARQRMTACGMLAGREERFLWALLTLQRLCDPGTAEHALRLSFYAAATARALGCVREEVGLVRQAALVHDIGKIKLAPTLLHKPGALTGAELAVMRTHPTLGRLILLRAGEEFARLAELVEAHHERWDGLGYPHGLARSGIPLGARILSVGDAFDAMTVTRPYHQAIPVALALAELARCAGSCFDPRVVSAFVRVIAALEQEGITIPLVFCTAPEETH